MNKRVLVCHHSSLVGLGVESLLAPNADLVLVNSDALSEVTLLTAIENNQPDVVILEECMPYASKTLISHILVEYPNLRVITVNIRNNRLNIYQKSDVILKQASDLVNVVLAI